MGSGVSQASYINSWAWSNALRALEAISATDLISRSTDLLSGKPIISALLFLDLVINVLVFLEFPVQVLYASGLVYDEKSELKRTFPDEEDDSRSQHRSGNIRTL